MSVIELKVPEIGESIAEVTLSSWLVADGEYVELDQAICEFESDKATLEFPAEAAGKLIHVASEGDDIAIGGIVAKIDTSATGDDQSAEKPKATDGAEKSAIKKEENKTEEPAPKEKSKSHAAGHPSPAAAKIMTENELKDADVEATGKDGRITKQDVLKALETGKMVSKKTTEEPAVEKAAKPVEPKEPAAPFSRNERTERMSRMRKTIATRLVSAKNNTAMLTTFNEVDMKPVMDLRKKFQDRFVEKFGIKLGFMSLFAKACAKALMEMPEVNARLADNEIVYHDYVDISIAISTPNGLVVPPVRNVESLNFAEIEFKIKALADKARDGKLSLEEMKGGTFTITNGGVFGSLMSTPILNEPQSAILGMHTIKERPVVIDGKIEIRPMMYLALSYDHRVIDGSTSVTFLVKVKDYLENPESMLLF
jgi:2-oxoglutarate dehydrogenase E2 component (dihydrolipoamide succinyltransferase)